MDILRTDLKNCYPISGGCSHVCTVRTFDMYTQKYVINDKLMSATQISRNITKLFGSDHVPLHIRDVVSKNS